jgi:hypothetical protein
MRKSRLHKKVSVHQSFQEYHRKQTLLNTVQTLNQSTLVTVGQLCSKMMMLMSARLLNVL